jgi:hypothetical protein
VRHRRVPQGDPAVWLIATLIMALWAVPVLAAWGAGALALRGGRVRRWWLLAAAVACAGLWVWAVSPPGVLGAFLWPLAHLLEGGIWWRTLLAGWARVLPLSVPAGLLLAAATHEPPRLPGPDDVAGSFNRRPPRQPSEWTVRRLAEREANRPSDALGVWLEEPLPGWGTRQLVIPPAGQWDLAALAIGGPGTGKSVLDHRVAYLLARQHIHTAVLDPKGGYDGLAFEIVANYLTGWPDARVKLFPQEGFDLWRGTPGELVNRLLQVWDWTEPYWRHVATLALRFALGAPGQPCTSTAELMRRLSPGVLPDLWRDQPDRRAQIEDMRKDLPGVQVRVANLVAALSGGFDGGWSFEDTDLAVITVPSQAAPDDADAVLRVLMSDYAHFSTVRKPPGQPSMLLFDEFSAMAGGRPLAINHLERGRGSRSGVLLSSQSIEALGNPEQAGRLQAAASAAFAFRQPRPATMAELAGTVYGIETADRYDTDGGRSVTYTQRERPRLDPNLVQQAGTGRPFLIAAGGKAQLQVIRTAIPAEIAERARALVGPPQRREIEPPPVPPSPPPRLLPPLPREIEP